MPLEKRDLNSKKLTIETETKYDDQLQTFSTKNTANILITTNLSENINVYLSLFSLIQSTSNPLGLIMINSSQINI